MELESLLQGVVTRASSIAIELLDASCDEGKARLHELFELDAVKSVHDTIGSQLTEYLRASNPKLKDSSEFASVIENRLKKMANVEYGTWVFYPWTGSLVHVLPKHEFLSLRTDRNRHKISSEEQAKLASTTIGIVGLSVGTAIATTLALEGVGGKFRLADFDVIGLSNLNRIEARISDLGENKAVIAARRMLELNPFLQIEVFCEGVTESNIDSFFGKVERLDILVEECDELWMKVRLREEARARKVAVVMETSDRGLLDIERFDRDPFRSLFHGLIGDTPSSLLRGVSQNDRIAFVLKILGVDQISPKACASMIEIGETISTWPQLGSSVIMGGAVATDCIRRIVLGEINESGRFSVDLEELVRDGKALDLTSLTKNTVDSQLTEPTLIRPNPSTQNELSSQEARWIVAHAIQAPSGGNAQPWKFSFRENSLIGSLDLYRSAPSLDVDSSASILALGAAAENARLAALELGFVADLKFLHPVSLSEPMFSLKCTRGSSSVPESELFGQIPLRCTNRRTGERIPLDQDHQIALEREALAAGTSLYFLSKDDEIEAIGSIIGRGDRLRMLDRTMHQEMMDELRWSQDEVLSSRDGIDIETLELGTLDKSMLNLLSGWSTISRLVQIGGGQGLTKFSQELVSKASCVCLLRIPNSGQQSFFDGGIALQRVWLRGTKLGLAFHPMTILVFLFSRLDRGQCEGFTSYQINELSRLRDEFDSLFPPHSDWCNLFLFRAGYASNPSARSLRRKIEHVI